MANKRDYYEVLGVDRKAGAEDIKRAYRRLAMKHHPDRNLGDESAEAKFKEVQEAYAVISDSDRRAAYDKFGHAGPFGGGESSFGRGGQFQGADFGDFFEDVFSDIFGGGRTRAGGRRAAKRGRDRELSLEIPLEEAAAGTIKRIRIPGESACEECAGSGARRGSSVKTCATCGGAGRVQSRRGSFIVQQTCPHCRGEGEFRDPCPTCGGAGRIKKARTLSIKIPAGIDDGEVIRLSGEGDSGDPGAGAGDLYIRVRLAPHHFFARDGDNLHCEAPLSIVTAALGGEITVPTLSGSSVLRIPAETQSGRIFRLRGKGIKGIRSAAAGDLLCRVTVETPVKLSDKQRDLLRQFGESLTDGQHNPRTKSWLDKVRELFSD